MWWLLVNTWIISCRIQPTSNAHSKGSYFSCQVGGWYRDSSSFQGFNMFMQVNVVSHFSLLFALWIIRSPLFPRTLSLVYTLREVKVTTNETTHPLSNLQQYDINTCNSNLITCHLPFLDKSLLFLQGTTLLYWIKTLK